MSNWNTGRVAKPNDFENLQVVEIAFLHDENDHIVEIKIVFENGRWLYIFPSHRDEKTLAVKLE